MSVAVTYHEEFGLSGDPVLKKRIIPSFNALKKVIEEKNIKVFTPQISSELVESVNQVHTPVYLQKVVRTGFYNNALLSAASVLQGARLVASKTFKSVFSYTGCAGHHAGRSKFWGYCYLNDAAIAINKLRQEGMQRFLILDVDPHFGDGTREFFHNDPDVIHINFCQEMTSHLDSKLNNYDYALRMGWDEEFLETLEISLKPDYDFDLMIVIFGHDSHYLDYGGFCLWDPTYPLLAKKVKTYANGRPLLWALSGGGDPDVAKTVIPDIVRTLAEDE